MEETMKKIFAVAAFVAVAFVGTALPASAKHGVDNPKPPVPVVVVPAPVVPPEVAPPVVPPEVVPPVAPPVVLVPAPVTPAPAAPAFTGTVTVNGICDKVTVTFAGVPAGTVAKIWWKFGRNNYSLAPNATLVADADGNGTKVVTTTRATNWRDQVQTRVQVEPTNGSSAFTVGGTSAYC
jgi:hypothetical protein